MPARLTRTILALAFACALGACGHHKPTFTVVNVALTEETPEGFVLTFTLEGENRNPEPFPLRRVHYGLSLDGRRVFSGSRDAETTLQRFGRQTLKLPVAIAFEDTESMPEGQVPYRFDAAIRYVLPGTFSELLFDYELRRPRSHVRESGRLDFDTLRAPG